MTCMQCPVAISVHHVEQKHVHRNFIHIALLGVFGFQWKEVKILRHNQKRMTGTRTAENIHSIKCRTHCQLVCPLIDQNKRWMMLYTKKQVNDCETQKGKMSAIVRKKAGLQKQHIALLGLFQTTFKKYTVIKIFHICGFQQTSNMSICKTKITLPIVIKIYKESVSNGRSQVIYLMFLFCTMVSKRPNRAICKFRDWVKMIVLKRVTLFQIIDYKFIMNIYSFLTSFPKTPNRAICVFLTKFDIRANFFGSTGIKWLNWTFSSQNRPYFSIGCFWIHSKITKIILNLHEMTEYFSFFALFSILNVSWYLLVNCARVLLSFLMSSTRFKYNSRYCWLCKDIWYTYKYRVMMVYNYGIILYRKQFLRRFQPLSWFQFMFLALAPNHIWNEPGMQL